MPSDPSSAANRWDDNDGPRWPLLDNTVVIPWSGPATASTSPSPDPSSSTDSPSLPDTQHGHPVNGRNLKEPSWLSSYRCGPSPIERGPLSSSSGWTRSRATSTRPSRERDPPRRRAPSTGTREPDRDAVAASGRQRCAPANFPTRRSPWCEIVFNPAGHGESDMVVPAGSGDLHGEG